MRFPLTQQLLDEAKAFSLRAACRDCFYWREPNGAQGGAPDGECWHGWPDEGQRSWPLARNGGEAADASGGEGVAEGGAEGVAVGSDVAFCKEFELR